jgi:hypothetical protein
MRNTVSDPKHNTTGLESVNGNAPALCDGTPERHECLIRGEQALETSRLRDSRLS